MHKYLVFSILLITTFALTSFAQVENVPADHRIYDFLHRMEVRQILPSYHGTIIPISRGKIAGYLDEINEKRDQLRGDRPPAS